MASALCIVLGALGLFLTTCRGMYPQDKGAFPKDFMFGASTSAYQMEGAWNVNGKGENIWDNLLHNNKHFTKDSSNGDTASDSYHKYREDVALAANLGLSHYKFSFSWSRIIPTGYLGIVNAEGLSYYENLTKEIVANNMKPVATIYHWDLPQHLQTIGGWLNPEIDLHFANYSRILFQEFPNIDYWITINDPREVCVSGYGDGTLAPILKNNSQYQCAYNILKAHARVYNMHKKEFANSTAKISIALSGQWSEPATNKTEDIEAAERRNQFEFGLYAHPIFIGDWPKLVIERISNRSSVSNLSPLPQFKKSEKLLIQKSVDFLALNTFTTYHVRNKNDTNQSSSYKADVGAETLVDPKWNKGSDGIPVVPWGMKKILLWINKTYGHPDIFITENGFADDGISLVDDKRISYHKDYLYAVLDTMREGVSVIGYTVCSLIDGFDWTSGYKNRFGLYHVNFSSPSRTRTPKKSANFYRNVARTHHLEKSEAKKLSGVNLHTLSIFVGIYNFVIR